MAGKLRYWKEKDGRFYARIAVPAVGGHEDLQISGNSWEGAVSGENGGFCSGLGVVRWRRGWRGSCLAVEAKRRVKGQFTAGGRLGGCDARGGRRVLKNIGFMELCAPGRGALA